MLLQIVSDLQVEHGNQVPAFVPEAHVLGAAGDIAPANRPRLLGDAVDE